MFASLRLFLFAASCAAFHSASAAGAADAAPPTDWVEKDTGHRVVRLSTEPGSASLYFHQNAYTADGDKMVFTAPSGIWVYDWKTREAKPLVADVTLGTNSSGGLVVAPKSRQVYYTKPGDDGVWVFATSLDTGATKKIAKLPQGGTFSSLNADETLLAGIRADSGRSFGIQLPGVGAPLPPVTFPDGTPMTYAEIKDTRMNERLESRIPMTLFTVNTATGEVKELLKSTDWLGHVQFSPTDPGLIMFCHEGPWHKVDRLWLIRTDGSGLRNFHKRTMNMEIAGHEFFAPDGKTIWYDLQLPRGEDFFLASYDLATGARTWNHLQRNEWSVHFNVSRDGKLFAGDGGDSEMVAKAPDGKWIYLFRPRTIEPTARIQAPNAAELINPGVLDAEKLVNLSAHDYRLEPNVTFTPDGKWIVFRSNMHGPSHVYAVEVAKQK